jgi:hypothetical protein
MLIPKQAPKEAFYAHSCERLAYATRHFPGLGTVAKIMNSG